MQITNSTNNYSLSFYALVPLNEYKGTVLKLTQKDKEQIAKLEKQIMEHRLDMYEHQKYKTLKKNWTEKDQYIYSAAGNERSITIQILEKKIREIKMNRLKQQTEKNK